MTIALHITVIIITFVTLWKGADWIVESAARVARRLGLSELVIGLTVVAIGTSAPEFAVSITAAIKGQADITIGNIVGSNIFNLGFILGGVSIFGAAVITRRMLFRDGGMLIGTGLLLTAMLADGVLVSWEGILLLSLLVSYIIFLFIQKHPIEENIPTGAFRWWDVPLIVLGITIVVTSAHFLIGSASELARLAGVSEWLIGVTIVAIGTSMPELATSFIAILRGRHGISIGNLIGSDLFNLLGVLGLAAVLRPLAVTGDAWESIVILAVFMVIVVVMMRTGWRISRTEAVILLILTAFRWYMNM
ncbi:MAG: sodium:calcium antiporter [Bacteroidetes bacterium]|nr:sodium:calcium antiporter [Bacteroidota bacterium]